MSTAMADGEGWRGTDEGKKLKSATSWDGTNDCGFSALPAGYRSTDLGSGAYFWTATESGAFLAWYRVLYSSNDGVLRPQFLDKVNGFSVRCLED